MNDETRLAEALRNRAGSMRTQHPLGLQDVKQRARGIRRRQVAASGLVAAAVLAVGVPAGMAADARLQRGSPPGPAQTTPLPVQPSETPTDPGPTRPPAPGPVTLDARVAETSGPAGIPVLLDGAIHTPSGAEVPVPAGVTGFLPLGEGWLVLGAGGEEASYLDDQGDVVWTESAVGALAVTPDGRIGAFTQPEGWTVTVDEAGERYRLMTGTPGRHEVAALLGTAGTCEETPGADTCTVYANAVADLTAVRISQAETGTAEAPRRGEQVDPLRGHVRSVSQDLLVSRTLSVDAQGDTCSQVEDLGTGERLFRTCDHLVDGFSPDGRAVVGRPSYLSGVGDGSVAVLDARTGEVQAEFRNDAETQAFVTASAWDVDGSLLTTVVQGELTYLVRITADGRLTRATVGDRSEWPSPDGVGQPVRLPTQP